MKHATEPALDRVERLLDQLRQRGGLTERQRGVFYRGSRAFLHFHEDPTGLFVDVREAADWERFPVTDAADWPLLLRQVDVALSRRPRP